MGRTANPPEQGSPQQRSLATTLVARNSWILAGAGIVLFHLAWVWQGDLTGPWLPGLGLGIALISWMGWRILLVLALDLFLVHWWTEADHPPALLIADTLIDVAQMGLSWWLYHRILACSRWLDDPQSAIIFLIVLPGGFSALSAILQGVLWTHLQVTADPLWVQAARGWLIRMVGIVVVLPFLLVVVTPWLVRWHMVQVELPTAFFGESVTAPPQTGEWIELIGLTFATSILALLLLWAHNWALWGCCLVLIVWTCIRQGLSGGCFSAAITSFIVLIFAQEMATTRNNTSAFYSATQGNLLAFCSTALLVGVSSSWIRATESRYSHVVGRIPVVLYSGRLPTGIPSLVHPNPSMSARESKRDIKLGPTICKSANIMLVSSASKEILGCESDTLIGPFARWLERIIPEDHEIVTAALAQLCLQKQPVTCEYRVRLQPTPAPADPPVESTVAQTRHQPMYRWVRDTLTPHYSDTGLVDGWEGLIEDITERRELAQNLRKITNMLQVLVTNLPTGVFFVQAPTGNPILVNARARQLLGQREDMAAGLAHLSQVYRLHRPDGTEYPSDELPISKALRLGITCQANDIVVHRADGRKIPLIAWAAPMNLHNTGVPDAAVWVLEDLSPMHKAETTLRESAARLRAIFESMSEGIIVQNSHGIIIECNPAACTILDIPRERLLNRSGFVPYEGSLQHNGLPFVRSDHPDQRALRENIPVRDVIVGLPLDANGAVRWLLVNSVPLPPTPPVGYPLQNARIVTTFRDITQQLQSQELLTKRSSSTGPPNGVQPDQ